MPAPATLDTLLDAALPHVVFDGWSDPTFLAAVGDLGTTEAEARTVAPRGAIDLAVALHRRGDRMMLRRMRETDLSEMRYRDRVATALRYRIEALPDRDIVRRATALFSLPNHSAEGARLIWETADHIWCALDDTSRDGSWYSKRATLSAVWASTVLYWLGDNSPDFAETKAFIDRRIDNVMQIESLKSRMRKNPLSKPFMDLHASILGKMRAPGQGDTSDLPGRWTEPSE